MQLVPSTGKYKTGDKSGKNMPSALTKRRKTCNRFQTKRTPLVTAGAKRGKTQPPSAGLRKVVAFGSCSLTRDSTNSVWTRGLTQEGFYRENREPYKGRFVSRRKELEREENASPRKH